MCPAVAFPAHTGREDGARLYLPPISRKNVLTFRRTVAARRCLVALVHGLCAVRVLCVRLCCLRRPNSYHTLYQFYTSPIHAQINSTRDASQAPKKASRMRLAAEAPSFRPLPHVLLLTLAVVVLAQCITPTGTVALAGTSHLSLLSLLLHGSTSSCHAFRQTPSPPSG